MLRVQTDASMFNASLSSYRVRWLHEAAGPLTVGDAVTVELQARDIWGNVIPRPMRLDGPQRPLDGPVMVVTTGADGVSAVVAMAYSFVAEQQTATLTLPFNGTFALAVTAGAVRVQPHTDTDAELVAVAIACPSTDAYVNTLGNMCLLAYCQLGAEVVLPGRVSCNVCERGRYSNGREVCKLCPAGQYADEEGRLDCIACAVGKYASDNGGVAVDDCIECPAGRYVSTSGSDQVSDCIACVAGKYTGLTGTATATGCTVCPAGSQTETGGVYVGDGAAHACSPCARGRYQSDDGAAMGRVCLQCPPGHQTETAASYDGDGGPTACAACSPGRYAADPASNPCLECAAGEQPSAARTACQQCRDVQPNTASKDGEACAECGVGRVADGQQIMCIKLDNLEGGVTELSTVQKVLEKTHNVRPMTALLSSQSPSRARRT
jgi:hypothetical protein